MMVEAVPKNEVRRVVVGNELLEQHSSHTVRFWTVREMHAKLVQDVAGSCSISITAAKCRIGRHIGL